MMKRSKIVSQSSDLRRKTTPLRKMHSSRKTTLHRSPQSSLRPSHSNIRRSNSSSVKRGTSSGVKPVRSPLVQSRSPSAKHSRSHVHDSSDSHRHLSRKKSYELVKRRSPEPPVGRGLSVREMSGRSVTPPQSSRYQGERSRDFDQDFDSPPKKKMQRMAKRYTSDHSPPRIAVSRPIHHQQSESSHRDDSSMHPSARDFAMSHSSDRTNRSNFHSQDSDRDGYFSSSLEKLKRHDQPRMYINEKQYGPTLDQRFSSDPNPGMEPRMHYSRSDLEKITIDIRPAVRGSSPIIRRITNPDDVKLVRRPNEGKKPIFDREEIKQAPRDMREDAHNEQINISSSVTPSTTHYGMTRRELKNYEITRHKFDSFHGPSSSNDMRTLNDRWQKLDGKKDERMSQRYMGKLRRSSSFSDDDRPNIPQSYDRDYRDDKYGQDTEPSYHRSDFPETGRSLSSNPADLRHSLSVRGKKDVPDSRDRMLSRGDDAALAGWRSGPKGMADHSPDEMRGKRSLSRGSRPVSPHWDYEAQGSRGNPRAEKLPSYARRSDRSKYQSWSEKEDVPTRSPSYFEPTSDRYSFEASRFRSPSGPVPSKPFRSRPYRGGRGGMRGRGVFRGGNNYRGYNSRGNDSRG